MGEIGGCLCFDEPRGVWSDLGSDAGGRAEGPKVPGYSEYREVDAAVQVPFRGSPAD